MITYNAYEATATISGHADIADLRYALRVAWEHTLNPEIRAALDRFYVELASFSLKREAEHSGGAPLNSVQAFLQRQARAEVDADNAAQDKEKRIIRGEAT